MKVLLDECIDVRLRKLVAGHDVFTVEYMKWKGISNGELLALAACESFDVFVTVDRGTLDQLPARLPLAVIVLRSKRNSLKGLTPMVPKLLAALSAARPGTIQKVE